MFNKILIFFSMLAFAYLTLWGVEAISVSVSLFWGMEHVAGKIITEGSFIVFGAMISAVAGIFLFWAMIREDVYSSNASEAEDIVAAGVLLTCGAFFLGAFGWPMHAGYWTPWLIVILPGFVAMLIVAKNLVLEFFP
ncbi:MAG TPA: hypothetical protein VHC68_00035 [Candidatus Paceibacterota bacterium]|nr:hypothetical protein [Candidatus Paceibacterota bacterium]